MLFLSCKNAGFCDGVISNHNPKDNYQLKTADHTDHRRTGWEAVKQRI